MCSRSVLIQVLRVRPGEASKLFIYCIVVLAQAIPPGDTQAGSNATAAMLPDVNDVVVHSCMKREFPREACEVIAAVGEWTYIDQ